MGSLQRRKLALVGVSRLISSSGLDNLAVGDLLDQAARSWKVFGIALVAAKQRYGQSFSKRAFCGWPIAFVASTFVLGGKTVSGPSAPNANDNQAVHPVSQAPAASSDIGKLQGPMGLPGVSLIAAERQRQISIEGYSPDHDDSHSHGELAEAACAYALVGKISADNEIIRTVRCVPTNSPRGLDDIEEWGDVLDDYPLFPWDDEWWKPSNDPIRNLIKSGALIAAEIDRLLRLNPDYAPSDPAGNDNQPVAPVSQTLPLPDGGSSDVRGEQILEEPGAVRTNAPRGPMELEQSFAAEDAANLAKIEHIPDDKLRAELATANAEIEYCHRLLDEHYGLVGDGMTSLDPLDDRLKQLLSEQGPKSSDASSKPKEESLSLNSNENPSGFREQGGQA